MFDSDYPQYEIGQARSKAMGIAVFCTIAAIVMMPFAWRTVWQTYLIGFFFVAGIPLGSLALLMLHHMTGGRWGFGLRRILEASTRSLPLIFLFFILLVLGGMNHLYGAWIDPHHHVELIEKKAAYLNRGSWILRGFICFAVWGGLAYFLNRWSKQQDETGKIELNRPMRLLSAIGVVLYVLAVTVAAWDWGMSLDPAWFSSMYGPLFMISQGLTTFAICIILVKWLSGFHPLSQVMTPKVYHDIGNLTFAFVILWAYMTIGQYLIIWCANLPEEIPYYLNRSGGGYNGIAVILALGHFAIPFLILLMRHNKMNPYHLVRIAWWILVMRFFDLYWHVFPAFSPNDIELNVATPWAPAALVAWYMYYFLGQLRGRPLVPVSDPRFDVTELALGAPAEAH